MVFLRIGDYGVDNADELCWFYSLFNNSEKDWEIPVILDKSTFSTNSFLKGGLEWKKEISSAKNKRLRPLFRFYRN